jgi:hypothetical protein
MRATYGFDAAMAILQDGLRRQPSPGFSNLLRDVELGEDVFLKSGVGTNTFDVQILPGNAEPSSLEVAFVVLVLKVLDIRHHGPISCLADRMIFVRIIVILFPVLLMV